MNILVPTAAALIGLALAYRIYPRYIARVFREDDGNGVPSRLLADGVDYVPSGPHVVFAHHYAAIAGAGPIVGPTLALAFGWEPVWLWILLGGIFFGAVHDMSSLFASVREQGKTIGEIARRALGPAGYVLFILVLLFVLTLINAIFLNLSIAALTSVYPLTALGVAPDQTLLNTVVDDGVVKAHIGGIATTSVIFITLCAPALGWLIRHDRLTTRAAYGVAFLVCIVSVLLGFAYPVRMDGDTWRYVMTVYVFLACALPLWFILQPRDFTNVQILYGGQLLLLVAVVVAGASGTTIQAPAAAIGEGSALLKGGVWPFLFITVACGAISGFHSLVASGTTVKQLPKESDCRRVGYGAMLVESFLAVLVLVAVASMLPRSEYLAIVYPPDGVTNPILGFAIAAGRLVHSAFPFIPVAIAVVFGILMVEGFVVTTLDSAVRLCRYLLEEFWQFAFNGAVPAALRNIYVNTGIAVALMVYFSLSGTIRQMWPVFGAGNQLIGALALVTVSVWLAQRARQTLFALVPAIFMIATTITALAILARVNLGGVNTILAVTAVVLLVLTVGVVVVGVTRFVQALQAEVPKPLVTAEP
ncbi:MAG: carbon starvation CstA family protein [Vicinamibacteraceae bacterium]